MLQIGHFFAGFLAFKTNFDSFQYEKEYFAMKDAERAAEDPLIRLERENKKLVSEKLRLEMENEYLARELVNSKIEMRKDIDQVGKRFNTYGN